MKKFAHRSRGSGEKPSDGSQIHETGNAGSDVPNTAAASYDPVRRAVYDPVREAADSSPEVTTHDGFFAEAISHPLSYATYFDAQPLEEAVPSRGHEGPYEYAPEPQSAMEGTLEAEVAPEVPPIPSEKDDQVSYFPVLSPKMNTRYDMPVRPSARGQGRVIDQTWLEDVGAYYVMEDDDGNSVNVERKGPASLKDNANSRISLLYKGGGGGWKRVDLEGQQLQERNKRKYKVSEGTVTNENIIKILKREMKEYNDNISQEDMEKEAKKVKDGFELVRNHKRQQKRGEQGSRRERRKGKSEEKWNNLSSAQREEAEQNYQRWNNARTRLAAEAKDALMDNGENQSLAHGNNGFIQDDDNGDVQGWAYALHNRQCFLPVVFPPGMTDTPPDASNIGTTPHIDSSARKKSHHTPRSTRNRASANPGNKKRHRTDLRVPDETVTNDRIKEGIRERIRKESKNGITDREIEIEVKSIQDGFALYNCHGSNRRNKERGKTWEELNEDEKKWARESAKIWNEIRGKLSTEARKRMKLSGETIKGRDRHSENERRIRTDLKVPRGTKNKGAVKEFLYDKLKKENTTRGDEDIRREVDEIEIGFQSAQGRNKNRKNLKSGKRWSELSQDEQEEYMRHYATWNQARWDLGVKARNRMMDDGEEDRTGAHDDSNYIQYDNDDNDDGDDSNYIQYDNDSDDGNQFSQAALMTLHRRLSPVHPSDTQS